MADDDDRLLTTALVAREARKAAAAAQAAEAWPMSLVEPEPTMLPAPPPGAAGAGGGSPAPALAEPGQLPAVPPPDIAAAQQAQATRDAERYSAALSRARAEAAGPAPAPAPAPAPPAAARPRPAVGGVWRPPDFSSPFAGQSIADLQSPEQLRAGLADRQRAARASVLADALGLSPQDAAFMASAGGGMAEAAKELERRVAAGEMSPAAAAAARKKLAAGLSALDAERAKGEAAASRLGKAWDTSEGLGVRMAASQMAGQREQGVAALADAAIGAEASGRQAELAGRQQSALAAAQEAERKAHEAYAATRAKGQQHLEAIGREVEQGTPSIERVWSKGSNVAGAALASVGALIGEIANGIGPKHNKWTMTGQMKGPEEFRRDFGGVKLIERIIDRDLEEQARQLDASKGKYDRQANLLAMGREAFGDDVLARESAKAGMLAQMAAEAASIAQQADSAQQRNAAQLTATQLGRMADEQQLRFQQSLAAQAEAARAQAIAGAQAQAHAAKQAEQRAAMAGKPQFSADPDLVGRYSPIVGGFLRDPKSPITQKQLEKLAAAANVEQGMAELQAIIDDPGSSTDPTARARAKALAFGLHADLAVAKEQGAIAEGEAERYKEMVPIGDWEIINKQSDALRATRGAVARSMDNLRAGISYTPGTVAVLPDDKGVPREMAAIDPRGARPYAEGVKAGKSTYYAGDESDIAAGERASARFRPLPVETGAAPGATPAAIAAEAALRKRALELMDEE